MTSHGVADVYSDDELTGVASAAREIANFSASKETTLRLLATIHEWKQRFTIATLHQLDDRMLGLCAAYKALAGYPEVESLGEGLRRIGLLIDENFDDRPWLAHIERPEREAWCNEKDAAERDELRLALQVYAAHSETCRARQADDCICGARFAEETLAKTGAR